MPTARTGEPVEARGGRDTVIRPSEEARGGMGARFGAAGMPLERSKDFKNSTRRLVGRLRPQTPAIVVILILSIVSVTLMAFGPKVLGHATNLIVDGVTSGKGIDFTDLHWTLLGALGLYVGAAVLSYCQAYMLAGVVQRSMIRLRADVETKLHRLPLRYVDRQPRGDLLSRVTNDIDNLQQSLQQTMSQLLTSTLSMIAVLIMMFTISWTLALIALDHRPGLDLQHQDGHEAVEGEVHRPVAPHRHAERAGRGGVHRPRARQGVRSPARRRADASATRTTSSSRPATPRSSSPGRSSR